MKSVSLIAFICALTASAAFGQRSDMARVEYYRTIRAAGEKGEQTSFRKTTKREYFEAGKALSSEEEIEERIAPHRSRYFRSEKSGDKIESTEMIKIGKTYYCRVNKAGWKVSEAYCGRSGFYATPIPSVEKFTVERVTFTGKAMTLYTDRSEYKDSYGAPEDQAKYWQHKYWINSKGFIIREEVDHGTRGSENTRGKWLVTYDYAPKNLTIDMPAMAEKPKP
jgi:hypothetical protein